MGAGACEIRDLIDCPHYLPTIARWMWEEWGRREGLTPEQSLRECEGWLQRDSLPFGIVAVTGEKPVGCMCLHPCDLDERPDLSPWMAYQYVIPEMRGRGIALALGQTLENKAWRLGFKRIYMWAKYNPAIYQRHGYAPLFTTRLWETAITVLCKDLDRETKAV
jgi:GNAT superfamily N-acetyltransferase